MPSFDTPEAITARIEMGVGQLHVRASDRTTTEVGVEPTDATNNRDVREAEGTRVEFEGGRLLVRAPRLRSWLRSEAGSIDVVVDLPTGSDLHATLAVGEARCDGRLRECRVRTGLGSVRVEAADTLHVKSGAGDVSVGRVQGHAEVVCGSGEVAVQELESTGTIRNSNGATWVGAVAGEVRLHAANGPIAVERAEAGVVAKSANGDIRLEDVARGAVVLETQVGDLEVGIRPGTTAWLDVNARAGRVHTDLDTAEGPDAPSETVEIRGRTTLGQVVIRRPRGVADVR